MTQRCANCRFFWEYDAAAESNASGDHVGACRRYPPSVHEDGDPYETNYIDVRPESWCGEWQPDKPDQRLKRCRALLREAWCWLPSKSGDVDLTGLGARIRDYLNETHGEAE